MREQDIVEHYTHGALLAEINKLLLAQHKNLAQLSSSDFAAIDEFHVGGRQASKHFFAHFDFNKNDYVLDLGCGLGGGARLVAQLYNASVVGIDLCEEYTAIGNIISRWLNLDSMVALQPASALSLPFNNNTFTKAYMMHVGMNIDAKEQLFKEVNRVLQTNAVYGIYDILHLTEQAISYPLPWAENKQNSAITNFAEYKKALTAAGFDIVLVNNRQEFAIQFFQTLVTKMESTLRLNKQPQLSLHTLMKKNSKLKMRNMLDNIAHGIMAPIEIIARKNN
jgi:ubiquinone/menaquinone biosynthesis C-methylase UbiE